MYWIGIIPFYWRVFQFLFLDLTLTFLWDVLAFILSKYICLDSRCYFTITCLASPAILLPSSFRCLIEPFQLLSLEHEDSASTVSSKTSLICCCRRTEAWNYVSDPFARCILSTNAWVTVRTKRQGYFSRCMDSCGVFSNLTWKRQFSPQEWMRDFSFTKNSIHGCFSSLKPLLFANSSRFPFLVLVICVQREVKMCANCIS